MNRWFWSSSESLLGFRRWQWNNWWIWGKSWSIKKNPISQIHMLVLSNKIHWSIGPILRCFFYTCCCAKSCPTLCDPRDGSPPGSPIPGILQARTLEWVAISFSNALKWKAKVKSFSHVQLLVTLWTAAYQSPPSMGFSRQEYWSRVPLPSPTVR